MNYLTEFLMGENGQSLTEYGLILALFVIAVIGSLALLGPQIISLFSDVNNEIN